MDALPVTPQGLIRYGDVAELGLRTELYSAVDRGDVQRVRRGIYAPTPPGTGSRWEREALEYRTRVLAAAETMQGATFTSFSAVALAGLPVFGRWPEEVYVLSRDGSSSRRRGVVTVARRGDVELDLCDGVRTTSIEFTLIQLCRQATLAAALVAVDAALRVPRFGTAAPMTTLQRLVELHQSMLPYHGSRSVEAVLSRATELADTPLETISRLAFEQLGFEAPELQREFWLSELGQRAYVDFFWRSVDAAAEADGRGKYRGSGRDAAEAVIREKDRENAIRRRVRAFDRWDWAETLAIQPLAVRLHAMGVQRTRRPRRLIPPRHESAVRRG
ncbi:type IV toxin-antitoxin system AbiEi family antitoxin domain-containing protein [Agromyces larvae]|uniref:Type IV toxin-antitoxin system AbiEi family antitoxin domain-containing protein n=1 Tax=Agromyces larvae TaxID=2929802 RepID=A0ABY4BX48_9MICO|nr:type IV toxin-antitoxin system AbiEi family antitoxin domain-containing protein [Agromyces larvae]UOE43806.1 type IV toxin-antitoxin system AbiEi family antitoxin domain-containing protein [Agromyces larvae]